MYLKPKVKAPAPELIDNTLKILQKNSVNTICLESHCPNITECFHRKTATFLILGDICTRACKFCSVKHAKPQPLDPTEPQRVAQAVKELKLSYVVITSVDRDDLPDYGASGFVAVTQAIKEQTDAKIELLTPDFKAKSELLAQIIAAKPYKLAHNIETVERLSKNIMPGCSYKKSLKVLETYAKSGIITKSSLMVGLGETEQEIYATLQDLRSVGVQQLTIGQYLQPTPYQLPVQKYYSTEEFEQLRQQALALGFLAVESGALVRSSYYADKL
ncbi:lipoyl synthase [Nitratiruptor tergarcus]|uniref:Lipoyl synthase n=1 Tax=Nitratiruptor tergarcus DSM 16512 TaxID=1069081 RepID=A0A1W1WVD0_9BACT|nr:lipoyl synthase [Nitratiruptor tergarcus]SMC09693.1 lipoic acid synthetase [Nitratiruptor tergarcus DSM 16512]